MQPPVIECTKMAAEGVVGEGRGEGSGWVGLDRTVPKAQKTWSTWSADCNLFPGTPASAAR